MPTIFITGANRGIGLEFTRQYGANGWKVIATCRNPIQPGELASLSGDIEVHGLDVTNHAQVDKLATDLNPVPIDVFVNNAGIYGPRGMTAERMDYTAWEEVFRVNTMAPFKLATTFSKHVARSEQKKLVNISSIMASNGASANGGEHIYRSSKAALNRVMRSFACDVIDREIIVSVFHPGWVKTDMGGTSADIDVMTSVAGMRDTIAGLVPSDSGKFFNYDGSSLLW
ncbi:MAG: hypothetical protein CBB68_11415 [Rhodospirillaceae bacterium TMED8]|nr:short-chain dehydrogenase [Magnetovibrio sp.]OUT49607.1 MAG: hypothetical protein CBB68_11415 [Rhodospirillaceae bacterium TMED8]|tara:strand:- start:289 stop:972 length:684 start_codon:yes stop_codon:yes gene_type:complete